MIFDDVNITVRVLSLLRLAESVSLDIDYRKVDADENPSGLCPHRLTIVAGNGDVIYEAHTLSDIKTFLEGYSEATRKGHTK